MAEDTPPAGTEIVREPLLSEPPAELIGIAGASGVMRASTGTVPTPDWTDTSRSTLTVAGIPVLEFATVLMLKNKWLLFTGME